MAKRRFKKPGGDGTSTQPDSIIKLGPGDNPDPRSTCPFKSGPVLIGAQQGSIVQGVQGANLNIMVVPVACDGPEGNCRFWDEVNECCMVEALFYMMDFHMEKTYPEGATDAEDEDEGKGEGAEVETETVGQDGDKREPEDEGASG